MEPKPASDAASSATFTVIGHGNDIDKMPHLVERGQAVDRSAKHDLIAGYDSDLMAGRTLLSEDEEKRLLRRVDFRLMPLLALILMVKNLDANNAANARIMNRGTSQNILTQLHMTPDAYNFVSTIYFIPFIIGGLPSNLIIKRMLPSRWQSSIMIAWGAALACHVAVRNQQGLYTARFFVGLFESGMFPGAILQLTYWYRADELSIRLLYFYVLGNFSSVISGVLAFAFDSISGRCGLSGWQWFFLVEAVITIAFGIALWFVLPNFPEQATWLTAKEKEFLQGRLPANAPRSDESHFKASEILEALKDSRMWLFTLVWATLTVGTSGLAFYQPTVIANLGFTSIAKSQLLNIPTAILAILIITVLSYVSDNTTSLPKPVLPLTLLLVMLACYAVLFTFPSNGGVYAATVISNACANSWYPMMWPWRIQTTNRATGAAFAIAFSNACGQIGFAIGPQIFQAKYEPKYTVSFTVAMCFVAVCILVTLWTWWVTRHTEAETRRIKKLRVAAAKQHQSVLDDVDIKLDSKAKA